MDGNHTTGVVFGFLIGIIQGISSHLALISWEQVFDTGSLAIIGGALGWCGAEIMKQIKKIYKKYKHD